MWNFITCKRSYFIPFLEYVPFSEFSIFNTRNFFCNFYNTIVISSLPTDISRRGNNYFVWIFNA